jgi:hypothetical protein
VSDLYALGRLVWRPTMLLALFPLGLVTGLAFSNLSSAGPDAADVVRQTVWLFATVAPAAIGLLLSMFTRELQHTLFGWTLPALSQRLFSGKLAFGGLFATPIALAALLLFDAPLGVAVFGWSVLSFAVGGVIFDPVLPKVESRGAAILLVLVAFGKLNVVEVIEMQPLIAGFLAAAVGVLLLRREFGTALSRKRPLTFTSAAVSSAAPGATRLYWTQQTQRGADWSGNLADGGLINWLRAAQFEGYGGAKAGFFMMKLGQLGIVVIAGFLSGTPNMVVYFPWIFMEGRRQLQAMLPYPLQRSRRATLFYLSTLVDSLVAAVLGLLGIAILTAAGQSFDGAAEGVTSVGLVVMLLSFAAWSPLVHWTNIRGPVYAMKNAKDLVQRLAILLVYVALAKSPGFVLPGFVPSGPASWMALVALGLVTHALYWLAVRRHFAGKDLVVAR